MRSPSDGAIDHLRGIHLGVLVEAVRRIVPRHSVDRVGRAVADGIVGVAESIVSDQHLREFVPAVVEVGAGQRDGVDRVRRTACEVVARLVPVDRARAEAVVPARDEIGTGRAAREGTCERPAVRQRVGDAVDTRTRILKGCRHAAPAGVRDAVADDPAVGVEPARLDRMRDVRHLDRDEVAAAAVVVCPHDVDAIRADRDRLVGAEEPAIVAVDVLRTARDRRLGDLPRRRVCVGNGRRSVGIRHAGNPVCGIVGVLLPDAPRPGRACPAPVVRVGVGYLRTVRIALEHIETAQRIIDPSGRVPRLAAVARGEPLRLAPGGVVPEHERMRVAADRHRAPHPVVAGLDRAGGLIGAEHLASKRVERG